MKRLIATSMIYIAMLGGWSMASAQVTYQSRTVTPSRFDQSPPLRKMSHLSPLMQRILHGRKATSAEISRLRKKLVRAGYLPKAGSIRQIPLYTKKPARSTSLPVRDADVQRTISHTSARAPNVFTSPSINFDGLGHSTGYTPSVFPPDPNAAVGMNYVVETVNLAFAVFKKSDGTMILGPVDTNTLWSGFGGSCQNDNNGDPIVMFDQLSQRWIISQFALSGPYYQCIAVSTTNDPTGSYYRYAYKISDTDINDYPKLGVWSDAYYYTANLFNASSYAFDGVIFGAFDRAQMVAGNPYAPMVLFTVPLGSGQLAYSVLPATLDGYNLPPAGAPGIFLNYVSPNLWGTSYYALQMWQMQVDWQTPANSTLTGPTQITVPAFNDVVCGGSRNCIPQPNSAPGLDAISDRLMYRLAYRNLGSQQALVVDQTVGVNNATPPAAMRWYQLTAPTDSNTWSLAQSGTFAPGVTTAGGPSRWMGSIAMDHHGDIALGYSLSSATIAPSIAYTGQMAGSTPGQMSEPETILQAGGGEQTAYGFRWGDYTSMASDPANDCTFWYTNEYYASTSQVDWSTHIGAFQFSSCTPQVLGTLSGTVTAAASGTAVQGADVVLEPGDIIAHTDAGGQYSLQLAAGAYTAQAMNYPAISAAASVNIASGQTLSQDFSLQQASPITVSGRVIDAGFGNGASAHGWGLYASLKILVPNLGQVAQAFTSPVAGAYSVQLPSGFAYTLNVTAHSNYQSAVADLGTVTQNTVHNFALVADAACDAPGYGANFSEDFNGGTFPPFGWAVTNSVSGSPVVWNTNVSWQEGNYTGGSGMAATADSNQAYLLYGYSGIYDTSLVSKPIPVAGLPVNPVLHFLLNYQEFSGNDALDLDIDVDGTGWTNVAHITSNYGALYSGLSGSAGGATYMVGLAPYIPTGAQSIRLRWHYYDSVSGSDWYAQVDDAMIGTCRLLPGGLVVGQVTDLESGAAVPGASVYDDLFDTTTSFVTSQDPNFGDLYILFMPAGKRTVMASGNSLFGSIAMNISADTVIRHDFLLGNADLAISSMTGVSVIQGTQGDVVDVVVTNLGPDTAVGVTLGVSSTGGLLRMESAAATQGTCSVSQTGAISCNLGDIASGHSIAVHISAFGLYVGQATVTVTAQAEDNDPNSANNASSVSVSIKAAPKPRGTTGGGGSFGGLALLLLLGFALVSVYLRRQHQRRSDREEPCPQRERQFNCNKESIMTTLLHGQNPMPRKGAHWALGVAIFLAVAMGVPGLSASAQASTARGHRGLVAVPAALVTAMARSEERTAGRNPAYRIDARGCVMLETQRMQACFGSRGTVRFATGSRQPVRLRLVAWGRGEALEPVRLHAGQTHGNRISYGGTGLKAWWQVLPIGYEQGFTISRAPRGHGKLMLELAASEAPQVHDGVLHWGRLRYGKLYVTDARGHRLPARLSAEGHSLRITITDAHARYPLTVDPLVWVIQRVMAPQPTAGDEFGTSVVLSHSGTTAVVGDTPNHAYIYTKSNGTWSMQTELIPTATGSVGGFGMSLALNDAGTIALVGARFTNGMKGAAFVFQEVNGTWAQIAELTANGNPFFAKFGTSVALNGAGTEALVGADFVFVTAPMQGAAYIFTDSNGTWTQTTRFTIPTGTAGFFALFGSSVALNDTGTVALVGAEQQRINGHGSQGAAYIFNYSNGAWSQQGVQLLASDGGVGNAFGSSLSLDGAGDVALVGAYSHSGGFAHQGAGYIFTDNNGVWSQSAELLASDAGAGDKMGVPGAAALSVSGNTALLGAPGHNPINPVGGSAEGAAYIFSNVNGTWTQTREFGPSGNKSRDRGANFGWAVAMSGDGILVGASRYYSNFNQPEPGAAYFFTSSDLSLVLDAPTIVRPAAQYVSQAILTNSSASASASLSALLPLPAGVTYVSAIPTQGSCNLASGTVACALGRVTGNGGSASVSLTLQAPPGNGQVKNQVILSNVSPAMNVVKSTAVGPAPSVSDLVDLLLNQSQNGTETFNIGGTGLLTVAAHSSNQTLLPDANIVGAGNCTVANLCTLTVKPAAQQSGNATVTVTITDSFGASATGTFAVSVTPPPSPSQSSASGGGSLGWLSLALLLGLAFVGRWRTLHHNP